MAEYPPAESNAMSRASRSSFGAPRLTGRENACLTLAGLSKAATVRRGMRSMCSISAALDAFTIVFFVLLAVVILLSSAS